jgi:hypothetical protein
MSFLRAVLVGLCLFASPAAWAFNPDQADPTVLASIELMAEGLTTWDRGDGPGEDDVALAEEGVFSFYLGELRARAWLAAHPEKHSSEEAQGLATFYELGNHPINGWAFGDPEALAAIVERVLAHDRAYPDPAIPADVMDQTRAGFEGFRLQILEQADQIRADRIAAGADVR